MDDSEIIALYFQRSEEAITQTASKYGKYCYQIAYHILSSREDSEESVNDTYLAAWKTISGTFWIILTVKKNTTTHGAICRTTVLLTRITTGNRKCC